MKSRDTFLIRAERADEAEAIAQVTRAAFAEAQYTSGTEALIIAALRAAGMLSVSLVAEQASEVIGHVAMSPVTISSGAPHWYGLGPVSVDWEVPDSCAGRCTCTWPAT